MAGKISAELVHGEVREVGVGHKLGNALVQLAKCVDSSNQNDDFETPTRFRGAGWRAELRLDEDGRVYKLERVFEVEAE